MECPYIWPVLVVEHFAASKVGGRYGNSRLLKSYADHLKENPAREINVTICKLNL